MKKLLAIILVGIMILSLCACGGEEKAENANGTAAVTEDAATEYASADAEHETEEDAVREAIIEARNRTWEKELEYAVKGGVLTKEKADEYSKLEPVKVKTVTVEGNKASAECETFGQGKNQDDEWSYKDVVFELENKDGRWVIYKSVNQNKV